MLQAVMMNTSRWLKQNHTLSAMSVLLAFVLQVVYIPLHLAHQEHFEASGTTADFAAVDAVFVEHDYGHELANHHNFGRNPEGHTEGHHGDSSGHPSGHPRHAALDHEGELLTLTAPLRRQVFEFHAVSVVECWAAPALRVVSFTVHPEAKPPRRFGRFAEAPRGPPAAV